jgi:hypothetical protein
VYRRLGLVLELLDGQHAMNVGQVVEVALELGKLRLDSAPQGWRHVNVMSGNR